MFRRFSYLHLGFVKELSSEGAAGSSPSSVGGVEHPVCSRGVRSQISKSSQTFSLSPVLLTATTVAFATVAFTTVALCVVVPSLAFAAGGKGGSGYNASIWDQIKFPLLNFALYCALIRFLYRKHVAPMLRVRSVQVEQHLNRSAAEMLAVEGELARVQERIARFEEEKQETLREFEQEGVRLAQAARRAAEAEALRVQQDAQNKLKNEWRALEKELRRDLVLSATERAVKRLSAGISSEREKALRSGVLRAIS